MAAATVTDVDRTAYPTYCGWFTELSPIVGAAVAVVVALLYGRPTHVIVTTPVLAILTGLGISLGYHRLFAHRSFATFASVERGLMILGCMASIAPFYWIAIHRAHHRHCDQDGDPHSPHFGAGRRLGLLRGLWHAYFDWIHVHGYSYRVSAVGHLTRRPDFVWIDRYWYQWYLVGLAIPGLIGFLIGGTAYDALIGFLWGGLFRHFIVLNTQFLVNTVCHLWGSRPYETTDHSRNNFLVALVSLGEGWHNNHHAFPASARHGLRWWQFDLTWYVLWLMERLGLAWDVKRPRSICYREVVIERAAACSH
jgi:stearoyl-CoA desaturase (Delta-9 desaturase)